MIENNIKFNKLGDALRYGFLYELHDLMSGSERAIHLYACLTYMKYQGYIEQKTIDCFNGCVLVGSTMIDKCIQKTCKAILSEITKKKEINSFDNLISLLNEEQIPEWCFNIGKWMIETDSAKYYIYEDTLFYVTNNNGQDYFVSRKLESICSEKSMEYYYDYLGIGYTSIYKFDEKHMKVYLKAKKQENKIHCYDILTDTFKIYRGSLHTLTETDIFIVTDDGYLAVIKDDRLHKIKIYDTCENYMLHESGQYFFVCPGGGKFFYPYNVNLDGKIFPADPSGVRVMLWMRLAKTGNIYTTEELAKLLEDDRSADISIDGIKEVLSDYVSEEVKSKYEKYALLLDMFEIISEYVDSKDNITKLLYGIYEANRVVSNGGDFPSRTFYYRFKEFVDEHPEEFKQIIEWQEYDKLLSVFSPNSGQEQENYSCNFHIGEIICENGNIKISLAKGEREVVVGDYIVPKIDYNNYFGMVAYNCKLDNYIVVSRRTLSESEKEAVINGCQLSMAKVIYVVDVDYVFDSEGGKKNE